MQTLNPYSFTDTMLEDEDEVVDLDLYCDHCYKLLPAQPLIVNEHSLYCNTACWNAADEKWKNRAR